MSKERTISKTAGNERAQGRPPKVTRRVFCFKTPLAVAGTAALMLGCEGSKNSKDAGVDGGKGKATDTDTATAFGTGTDTGNSMLGCVEFTDQKNEALLRTGERVVLGKEGFYMKATEVGFGSENTKVLQVQFFDVLGNQLDKDGNVAETPAEKFNATYKLDANTPELTIKLGSEEQTIALCSIKAMDEGDVAFVTTDYPDGFLKGCEYISGVLFDEEPVEYTANGRTTQTMITTKEKKGFVTEDGERCEDAQFAETFVKETSTFVAPIEETPTIPPTFIRVRGTKYQLVSADLEAGELELVSGGVTGVLYEGDVLKFGDLAVMNTGTYDEITGEPVLACSYQDENVDTLEFVSLEKISQKEDTVNLFKVTVRGDGNTVTDEFIVRYMEDSDGKLSLSIYRASNIRMLKTSEPYVAFGREHTVEMGVTDAGLNKLTISVAETA